MKSLKRIGLGLGTIALVSTWSVANQCLMGEEAGRGSSRGGGTAAASDTRIYAARFPLPPAGRVTVENVQGDIRVEAWDRAQVEVVATRRATGRPLDLDDVRVEVESGNGSLAVRTAYPRPLEEPVRVDFHLRVPRQVQLDNLRTVVGNIRVRDIEGSIDARTLSGDIEETNITGGVAARALNGNVMVSLRTLAESAAPVHMETVNGHLYLALPAQANASLEVSTVSGRIDSNYAFKVSEVPGDSVRRTTIGKGGTEVRLRTVRGDIHVTESDELL